MFGLVEKMPKELTSELVNVGYAFVLSVKVPYRNSSSVETLIKRPQPQATSASAQY